MKRDLFKIKIFNTYMECIARNCFLQ